MTSQQLTERIRSKNSYLCVGLDTDPARIPPHLHSVADPVFEFNRQIIDATKDHCVAYKINTAFYESMGAKGWETLERTAHYIPATHLRIADAKRGDIGNTSAQYARAFFETLPFDAITVSPYMGEDSLRPFLDYAGKWTIVLALTSNPGAQDFELQQMGEEVLYEKVLRKVAAWGSPHNLMFVIGATQADSFARIRQLTPDHFYLVPGVGSQGGSLGEISAKAMNKEVGLLVNVSRGIIYRAATEAFAEEAGARARDYQVEMTGYLQKFG
jgi:orotidine-5'-phosphate decarboxylase